MRITPQELPQLLNKNLAPLYFLYGPEEFLLQESHELIKQKIRALGEVEILYFNVEATALAEITARLEQTSLFTSLRLIQIKIKKLTTPITTFLHELLIKRDPSTYFIVHSEQLTSQQQQASWFLAILQHAVVIGHWPLNISQFTRWVQQKAQQSGLSLKATLLQRLIAHTQGNCLAAAQMIQQWALNQTASTPPEELAVLAQQSQFTLNELSEAILRNQPTNIIKILSSFKETGVVAPQLVLWGLTQLINTLLKCLITPLTMQSRCLGQAGIRGPQQALYLQALKKISPDILLASRAALAQADYGLKSGQVRDISQNLLEISLSLSGVNLAALRPNF